MGARRRSIRRTLTASLAVAALLAACGGDDDDEPAAAPTDASEPAASTATTVAEAAATTSAESPATTTDDAAATTAESSPATSDATDADWEAVTAAAAEEGKVTLYSTQTLPVLEALEPAFEAAHPGIDLEVIRGLPQDLVPTLDIERQTGSAVADVYINADTQHTEEEGQAGHYVAPVGPSFDNPDYDRESNVRDGGYFLSHAVIFGWGWNTNDVPEGLDGYEAMLDPALAGGRIGVPEPANQALVDFWLYLEDQYGADFIDGLAAQEPRIYPGGGPIQEALTSGEIGATIYAGAAIEDGKANGAPIEWQLPDTPSGARYWVGVLDIAPHPNAAQVFADYLVTPEGQAIVAKNNASTLPNIETALAEIGSVPEQDTARLTPEFVQSYLAEWRSQFQ